ncbi:hypothetical protein MPNTM1_04183 [Mycolicibacterium parafortuitum]|uniref:flagellar hook-length control protein n=1 Tax=Mycolicibacterium parafortuitum TaxID=39692 RepID=UPI0032C3E2ED
MSTTKADSINAAMSIAEDVAAGTVDPAGLDQAVADECRALFGQVVGDGDPLWPLHRDITRQSIALAALSADELGEWQAVMRRREAADGSVEPGGSDMPGDAYSSASGPHSPDSGDPDTEPEAGQ